MADTSTMATRGARRRARPPQASEGREPRRWGARYAMLPLRLFLGATFVYAGVNKLADPHFLAGATDSASFVAQMQSVRDASPLGSLLDLALQTPVHFAIAMAFGELAVSFHCFSNSCLRRDQLQRRVSAFEKVTKPLYDVARTLRLICDRLHNAGKLRALLNV